MKRHVYHLSSHYTNTIHKVMNDLVQHDGAASNPLETIIGLLDQKYPHITNWTDDPLLHNNNNNHYNKDNKVTTDAIDNDNSANYRLHMDLCLHFMYSALLSYVESAYRRNDLHVVCYALLLMVLLWRKGGQVGVRQDRLEWIWRALQSIEEQPCADGSMVVLQCRMATRFLRERNVLQPIIWSRSAPSAEHRNISTSTSATPSPPPSQSPPSGAGNNSLSATISGVFDNRTRLSEHRRVVRIFTDDLLKHVTSTPLPLVTTLPRLNSALDQYARSKEKALSKSKFSKKSRMWKSGLNLMRENFGAQVMSILDSICPGSCTNVALIGDHGDDIDIDEAQQMQVVAPSPKRPKTNSSTSSSSSSSSSTRSSTPFQEAKDMPSII